MTNLDQELLQLKAALLEMMVLVQSQLEKAKEAFINMDQEIAEEIIHTEKHVNAMELSIDRDCKNIFALFQPLATDLRFVISTLKINSDLERIGDYAENIANYVMELQKKYTKKHIEKVELAEMFDVAIEMLEVIICAYDEENSKMAMKVFKMDTELNRINERSSDIICDFVEEDVEILRKSLFLFSSIRKLERVGDHIKNVAEDIIFYLEAKVLKHKKSKGRMPSA